MLNLYSERIKLSYMNNIYYRGIIIRLPVYTRVQYIHNIILVYMTLYYNNNLMDTFSYCCSQ